MPVSGEETSTFQIDLIEFPKPPEWYDRKQWERYYYNQMAWAWSSPLSIFEESRGDMDWITMEDVEWYEKLDQLKDRWVASGRSEDGFQGGIAFWDNVALALGLNRRKVVFDSMSYLVETPLPDSNKGATLDFDSDADE